MGRMECPPWLWQLLLNRYWPKEFLHHRVAQGLAWTLEKYPDQPTSEESPVFVFSAGWRSGSTLLQRLLNSNPEVMVWGEAYEHALLFHHLAAPLTAFTKVPLDLHFLPEGNALPPDELAELLAKWTAILTPSVADFKRAQRAYLETLFKQPAVAAGRPRWGVKMVRGTAMVAHYLRWLYPKAKFLFLFRDPYAAFQSYQNLPKKRGWYLYFPSYRVRWVLPFAVHWKHCMDDFSATHEELDAFLVRYEDLVSGKILGPLQDYLGMPIDETLLDVKVNIAGKTGGTLTATQRTIIGFITGNTALQHGYTGADVQDPAMPVRGA